MSGSAPAIQSDGPIWLVTGNGQFDGSLRASELVGATLGHVETDARGDHWHCA